MITADLVKQLREKTGAGMMDCKKVLTETDGDMEKAAERQTLRRDTWSALIGVSPLPGLRTGHCG